MKKLQKLLLNTVFLLALITILSTVVDWYRKPSLPVELTQTVQYDSYGEPHIIAQQSYQRPLLIYVWGSWCGFCEITTPYVAQLSEEGVPVLGIALKSGSEQEVNRYLSEHSFSFPTLNDPNGVLSQQWQIQVTPTFLIIKNGKILNHTTGLTTPWGLRFRLWLAEFAP